LDKIGELHKMKKILCAGVLALAMTGLLPILPAAASDTGVYAEQGMAASINVARIKRVLHLRSDQERYWPAVEAALNAVARRQQSQGEQGGIVRRISHRVVSIVLDNAAVARVAAAARPLIAVLDQEQMQAASGLANEMGLGPVVAALR
jgi:hypothetical protein